MAHLVIFSVANCELPIAYWLLLIFYAAGLNALVGLG
jgi:hypothetical protein